MSDDSDLVALVGSRICHDLVSPLGAIANGLELMMMAAGEETPEMALVNESVAGAKARIRYFRLAFGEARPEAVVRAGEIAEALATFNRPKLVVDWQAGGDLARQDVKLSLLALNCLESAMPYGGVITIRAGEGWQIDGTAERLRVDPSDWQMLQGTVPSEPVPAAKIHFALLARERQAQGRTISIEQGEAYLKIDF